MNSFDNWKSRWLTDSDIKKVYEEIDKKTGDIFFFDPVFLGGYQKNTNLSFVKKKKLKDKKLIFAPLCLGSHWTLFVLERDARTLHFYNSLKGCGESNKGLDFFRQTSADLGISGKQIKLVNEFTPQQNNGSDCGVFVIAITRLLVERYEEGLKNEQFWEIKNENDFIFSILKERAKIDGKEISSVEDNSRGKSDYSPSPVGRNNKFNENFGEEKSNINEGETNFDDEIEKEMKENEIKSQDLGKEAQEIWEKINKKEKISENETKKIKQRVGEVGARKKFESLVDKVKNLTKFSEKKLFKETEKEILDFINSSDVYCQKYKGQTYALLKELKKFESIQDNSNKNVSLFSKEICLLFFLIILLLISFSFLLLKRNKKKISISKEVE